STSSLAFYYICFCFVFKSKSVTNIFFTYAALSMFSTLSLHDALPISARQFSMPGKDISRMRAIFDQELSQVGEGLHRMATQVQDAVQLASQSLASADLQAAEQVIQADDAIDAIERELDERGVMLLARQQPVATDLRVIVTALRISASIERMGDLARHIAQVTRMRFPEQAIPEQAQQIFAELAESATAVAANVVELLDSHDVALAAQIE